MQRPQGLFCPAGNFYIDPSSGVENAVITHAHSDHARRGSKQYFCVPSCEPLLKSRLGKHIPVRAVPYGQVFRLGAAELSFHPAGHILGSAQVRLHCDGQVWVVSGDYKREADPTCEAFESVPCDVFVTEATFGTPSFRWDKSKNTGAEIYEWWQGNAERGVNSVLFAYSLGKTQRLLGMLAPLMKRPVFCTDAAMELIDCYRECGIAMAPVRNVLEATEPLRGELIIAPQSFLKSKQASCLGNAFETAFASGWMKRGSGAFEKGFVVSDHADWDDLLRTILETGARRVYVQHRGNGALVKHLRTLGLEAFPDSELKSKVPPEQMVMF